VQYKSTRIISSQEVAGAGLREVQFSSVGTSVKTCDLDCSLEENLTRFILLLGETGC
jgi:hypothetical protein